MPTLILLLLGGLALWGVARLVNRETAHPSPALRTPAGAIGVVFAILLCGQWLGNGLSGASTPLKPQPTSVPRTTGIDTQGGDSAGLSETALAAAAKVIPPDARIRVACPPGCTEITAAWILTRLAPRVPVQTDLEAQWMIFSGIDPADPTFAALQLDATQQVGDSLWVARVVGRAG